MSRAQVDMIMCVLVACKESWLPNPRAQLCKYISSAASKSRPDLLAAAIEARLRCLAGKRKLGGPDLLWNNNSMLWWPTRNVRLTVENESRNGM